MSLDVQVHYLDLDDFRFRCYVAAALAAVKFLKLSGLDGSGGLTESDR